MEERKTTQDGFTLIEVMIVAAIIAIIAAIAYPSYAESVKKAKRADATGELTSLAQKLERCHVSEGAYNAAACPSGTDVGTENGNYLIDVTADARSYELVAKPQFDVRLPGGVRGGGLGGAMNFLGKIGNFNAANSNKFSMDGNGGPAVGTSNQEAADAIDDAINDAGRADNYQGGVDQIDYPAPWEGGESLQDFINQVKLSADYVGDSSGVTDLGSPEDPQVIVVEGDGTFSMTGNQSGAGMLVVTGDLTFSGTPSWDGVIISLGGEVNFTGGGKGGVTGGMFVGNLNTETGQWELTDDGSNINFDGGGSASFQWNCESLKLARNRLNAVAQSLWQMDNQCDGPPGTGTPTGVDDLVVENWLEVVDRG